MRVTGKRSMARGIADAPAGFPLFLTAPLSRHWHLRWGATDSDLHEPMPGDDAVPRATVSGAASPTLMSNAGHMMMLENAAGFGGIARHVLRDT